MQHPSALCATVTADTTAELCRRRDAASGADLVELRLDGVQDVDVAAALAGRRVPVIVTCRSALEGGHFTGSEDTRRALLLQAWRLGAEYVDIEASADTTSLMAESGGQRVVLSWHDFHSMPADLEARALAMESTGAEVVKIAVTPHALRDVVRLRALGRQLRSCVVLGMGISGLPSRVLAAHCGSRWTYAGEGVAPGQLPLVRMRDEYGVQRVTADTPVYALLGNPVGHSVSPAMHNAAFRAAGLDAVYLPCQARDFDDFAAFAEAFGIQGASVTAPFKLEAFRACGDVDVAARRTGAVNTLRRTAAGWEGRNTDGAAFLAPLAGRVDWGGTRVSVLGAGGAARTVATMLRGTGARVLVHARNHAAALAVATATGTDAALWPPEADWDVLVNATPVGTFPGVGDSPLPGGPFPGRLVYDLVYNPPETRLLRDAARAGCETIGGLDMLVAQADAQFTWWTGHPPTRGVMREAALRRLSDRDSEENAHGRTP